MVALLMLKILRNLSDNEVAEFGAKIPTRNISAERRKRSEY
jgi:hypothetical protein